MTAIQVIVTTDLAEKDRLELMMKMASELDLAPVDGGTRGAPGPPELVWTLLVLPFVNALVTKFGETAFEKLRGVVRYAAGHLRLKDEEEDVQVLFDDTALGDPKALAALRRLDLKSARGKVLTWDEQERKWKAQ